jgi:hypothetical protein
MEAVPSGDGEALEQRELYGIKHESQEDRGTKDTGHDWYR